VTLSQLITSNQQMQIPFLRQFTLPAVITVAGLVIALPAFVLSRSPANELDEPTARPSPVNTLVAELESSYDTTHRFLGRVESARASRLGFELPGTVIRLHAEEGDFVAAGALLAELDTRQLATRRADLAAARDQATATRDLAFANFERTAQLIKSRVATTQEIDSAREQRDAAAAARARIDAQMAAIDVDLSKSRLVAPYAGTIARRAMDEGTVTSPAEPVFEILESGSLEIRAGLAPAAITDLASGTELTVHPPDETDPLPATVSRILPARDSLTRTIDVILETTSSTLRPGDLVEIPITRTHEASGIWLPREALTESSRGLWAAYVVEPETQEITRRQLQILHETTDRVFVQGALNPGDEVVTSGLQKLVPGLRVTAIPTARREKNPLLRTSP